MFGVSITHSTSRFWWVRALDDLPVIPILRPQSQHSADQATRSPAAENEFRRKDPGAGSCNRQASNATTGVSDASVLHAPIERSNDSPPAPGVHTSTFSG